MQITLEMIDQVRQRAGISYRQARELLERAEGDVVEALCLLEEDNPSWHERVHVRGEEIRSRIKEIVREGNVRRITLKKDGQVMLDIPVTVGAVGALLAPELAALGLLAALAGYYTVEVERRSPEEGN